MIAITIHQTLTDALAGCYAEYEQSADETGLPGPSLVYAGPYPTKETARAAEPDAKKIIWHPGGGTPAPAEIATDRHGQKWIASPYPRPLD